MTKSNIIEQALQAAGHPILLQSESQLESAVSSWAEAEVLGVDTEFFRERTYRADLGLVQVYDGSQVWLADPVSADMRSCLIELLDKQTNKKVLHSCTEDLEVLFYQVGAIPNRLIDTQIACALMGQPLQMGYHHTVKWLFDVEIDKDQTRSNWMRRPLNDKQLRYAAMDVVFLPEMAALLEDRLEENGRHEWLSEEVDRLKVSSIKPTDPNTAYLRFTRAGRLDQESIRILQALAEWREIKAMDRNLARGFVVPDITLLKLAHLKPTHIGQLTDIEGLHPKSRERNGKTFIRLIEQAVSSDQEYEMPEELTNGQKKQLNRMRQCVRDVATSLEIDPALLASKRELERLIRALSSEKDIPERFTGWRKEIITDQLLDQ